jgi:hypothetical protein
MEVYERAGSRRERVTENEESVERKWGKGMENRVREKKGK